MTDKERYSAWCKDQPDLPVFMQPWWLDAVTAGKGWDVLLYLHPRTERILAAMPYLTGKRWRMHYVLMPQQTQIGGIWADHSLLNADGSSWDRDTLQTICDYMVEQLQKLHLCYYYQHYPLGSSFPALLANRGMTVRDRVTYRIEDLSDMDAVIRRFAKSKQRQLRKAEHLHCHVDALTAEQLYYFHRDTLAQRHKVISYTREFLLVLDRKTRRNNCSHILSITDNEGTVYAAAYVVWDNRSLYYLIPAYAPDKKDSGAVVRLVTECIRLARDLGLTFDFEGSMIRSVARFYKQFGATPVHYCSVEKYYKWWFRLPYWAYRIVSFKRR